MKIKNDEGRRRENVPGMGKVARGVGDAEQYSLFIGHFVTIAFESRFTLLVARCSSLVLVQHLPFLVVLVSFRVAFDFQFALWHFLCVYGIDR